MRNLIINSNETCFRITWDKPHVCLVNAHFSKYEYITSLIKSMACVFPYCWLCLCAREPLEKICHVYQFFTKQLLLAYSRYLSCFIGSIATVLESPRSKCTQLLVSSDALLVLFLQQGWTSAKETDHIQSRSSKCYFQVCRND